MSKEQQYFHVYKKNTDQTIVIAHNLTVDQLEEKLKNKTQDQLSVISKNFSFYTTFRNSLKEINKGKNTLMRLQIKFYKYSLKFYFQKL